MTKHVVITEKNGISYEEEKTIFKTGSSIGVALKPKILNVIGLKKGDKVKVCYNFIKKEIIIVGVNDGKL